MGRDRRPEIHNERCLHLDAAQPPHPCWPAERTVWYATGREALVALLRAMEVSETDTVLLPTFAAQGLIAPCRAVGARMERYRVTAELEPDWFDLEARLAAARPRVAVLIHYFGLPQDVGRFHALCRAHGTRSLEDRAHLLHHDEPTVGATADVVLYSLPKLIGVPDAAPMVVNTDTSVLRALRFSRDPRHGWYVFSEMGRLGINTLSRRLPRHRALWAMLRLLHRLTLGYRVLMSYFVRPTRASHLSRWLAARIDWEGVITHRRALTTRYRERLNAHAFRPFARDPLPGTCGIGFPVLVDDRAGLESYLAAEGVAGLHFQERWDNFDVNDPGNDELTSVVRRNFLFPTDRSLSLAEVDLVIDLANAWAKRTGSAPQAVTA
jgi:hypothetical protein